MVEVKGYKGFSKDLKNEPGNQFEVGKVYRTENERDLLFGHRGNGFHFCKSLEDCFIYFDPSYSAYAEVTGLEEVREKDDEFNDIYGICVARTIRIDRILTNEEIVDMYLNPKKGLGPFVLKRFIQFYKLTPEQIQQFEEKYYNDFYTLQDIMYYQRKIENVYSTSKIVADYQKKLKYKFKNGSDNK